MDNHTLNNYGVNGLINKNKKKREEEFYKKVNVLAEKAQKQAKLSSYFLKNTSVNIWERIIVICLNDVHVSGIAKTQDDEVIAYKRHKNSIKFRINKSSYSLSL